MNDTLIIILIILVLILILLLVAFFIYLRNKVNNTKLQEYIKTEFSQKNLQDIQLNSNLANTVNQMNASLNKDLLNFNSNLNNDFVTLSDKLNKNMIDSYKQTSDIYGEIVKRMTVIDETQKKLNSLSEDILSLQSILNDKKSRGTFGEIELYSLLETSFGNNDNRYQRQYKLPNGHIADAVIFGGDTLGTICIDSKFPLDNYRRIYDESLSKIEKEEAKRLFKNDVLKHLKDIKDRYIIPNVTSEMAYMFIPAEAVFSEIYSSYPDIVEKSYEYKVYLVSPTTLMAYITAIRSIYIGQIRDKKAKEIELLLNDLGQEFLRFKDRNEKLRNDFIKIGDDFKEIDVTSSKIIKKFDSIKNNENELN